MSSDTSLLFLKALLFGMIVPGTGMILFPYLLLSPKFEAFRCHLGIIRFVGAVPIVMGGGVVLWCWWEFFRKGKGTPSPTESSEISGDDRML